MLKTTSLQQFAGGFAANPGFDQTLCPYAPPNVNDFEVSPVQQSTAMRYATKTFPREVDWQQADAVTVCHGYMPGATTG